MEEIEGFTFGQSYTGIIPLEEADKFSRVFGEGSKALTELIKYCIVNGIPTFASCKGHPEDFNPIERVNAQGYIAFSIEGDYKKSDFAYFLASLPFKLDGVTSMVRFNEQKGRTIILYVDARTRSISEKAFNNILNEIKNYKQLKKDGEKITYNPDVLKIVDETFSFPLFQMFLINKNSYSRYKGNGIYKRIGKCPAYRNTNEFHTMFTETIKHAKRVDRFVKSPRKL